MRAPPILTRSLGPHRTESGGDLLNDILLAAAGDTNPKRQRGLQLVPSLTLRVSVGCSIPDRAVYILINALPEVADNA